MKKVRVLIFIGIGVVLAAVIAVIITVASKFTASSMKLEDVRGAVSLFNVKGDALKPEVGVRLFDGNRLDTREESRAVVLLDEDRFVYLMAESGATVNKKGKALSLSLDRGSTYFYIAKDLANDESFEIRTSTMIVGIRGTSGYVTTDENGAEVLYLTSGKVEVFLPEKAEGHILDAGKRISVSRTDGDINVNIEDFSSLPQEAVDEILANEDLKKEVEEALGWDDDRISGATVDNGSANGEALGIGGSISEIDGLSISNEGYAIFGKYEQDGDLSNGPDPIEWEIHDGGDKGYLLVSRYVLECREFDVAGARLTWEDSDIRNWLNGEFYDEAFTDSEKEMIKLSKVLTCPNPFNGNWDYLETYDKVFLLGAEDIGDYYHYNQYYDGGYEWCSEELIVAATPYVAEKVGNVVISEMDYYDENDDYSLMYYEYSPECIGKTGSYWLLRDVMVNDWGETGIKQVLWNGTYWDGCLANFGEDTGIRPALYINK